MILSIISVCLSAFTAIIVTIMPVIQTLINNRNNRIMNRYRFVQKEQRTVFNELLERYTEYSLNKTDENIKKLCLTINKAQLFAKESVELRRYEQLRQMLLGIINFDEEKFNTYFQLNIKCAWEYLHNIMF